MPGSAAATKELPALEALTAEDEREEIDTFDLLPLGVWLC
jgi:hypothetical protein